MSNQEDRITVVTDPRKISPDDIGRVYNSVGFTIPDDFRAEPGFMEKMYAPGAFGFFAFADNQLIGAARVLSDDAICSWVPEVVVMPEWQKKGVGKILLKSISERFAHTAIYTEAFKGTETFFEKQGIRPKEKLVACSKAPAKKRK